MRNPFKQIENVKMESKPGLLEYHPYLTPSGRVILLKKTAPQLCRIVFKSLKNLNYAAKQPSRLQCTHFGYFL